MKQKNKYQVCIDLTHGDDKENTPLIESPLFDTEEKAIAWLNTINFIETHIDTIMCVYDDKGKVIDSYLCKGGNFYE